MAEAHQKPLDEQHCVLCCEDIEFSACGPCDHSICLKCCLKLRMLRKETDCPVCRAPLKEVIVSKGYKRWSDKNVKCHSQNMRKFGILHEVADESKQKVDELLQHKCPVCDEVFEKFPLVKDHVRKAHSRYYCDICLRHLKLFTHERKCYTREQLVQHRKHGDADDKSHRGHPLCKFCDDRYLDNDDLLHHLRKNHFWCHLCEKDGSQDYFPAYDDLRGHFRQHHFLCEAGECAHEKFTSVFRTKIDLQAHRAQKHSDKLSKAEARQNRQLDVDITFARPRQPDIVTGRDYSYPEHSNRQFGGRSAGNRDGNMTRPSSGGPERRNEQSGPGRDGARRSRDAENKRRKERGNDMLVSGDLRNQLSKNDGYNSKEETSGSKAKEKQHHENGSKRTSKDSAGDKRTSKDEKISKGSGSKLDKKGEGVRLGNGSDRSNVTKSASVEASADKSSQNINNSATNVSQQRSVPTSFHDDFPTLSSSKQPSSEPTTKTVKQAIVNPLATKSKASKFDNDFPALPAHQPSITVLKPSYPQSKISNQKQKSVVPKNNQAAVPTIQPPQPVSYHEDFPTLSSFVSSEHAKPAKAPPGLTRPAQPRPPPGLTWNVPLSIKPINSQNSANATGNKNSKDNELIEQIQRLLYYRGKDFAEFKTISGQFRTGQITAQSYYKGCCDLLGNENVHKVFSKLINILPDEEKQKELLTVYNDAKILAKQGVSQPTKDNSSVAESVLSVPSVSLHEDFPALPSTGAKKSVKGAKNNKLNAWVNGK